MAKRFTRRGLIAAAAPIAAAPIVGRLAFGANAVAAGHDAHPRSPRRQADHAAMGHAAMIGEGAPAVGGPHDLDDLLYPPPALPASPGRVREYTVTAIDKEIEIAPGVFFPAWTYNGTVPGPVLRATEGDILRVRFVNAGTHPHTMHFHGIHPSNMDGVFEIVYPGDEFTYEFEARPGRLPPVPLPLDAAEEAPPQGALRRADHRPAEPRPEAQELVMVMNGYDTDGDGDNNFYTVNGRTFYYARYPIQVSRSKPVRIYLANLTEFDLINSFHLHADFFRYQPTGTGERWEYTDIVMQCQGQRGVIEIEFANTGKFMFHAHQAEFTELGWMGFFDVTD